MNDRIKASLAINAAGAAHAEAQLRWFIASDRIGGRRIAGRLTEQAVRFCREKRYPRIYLRTFKGLDAARHVYGKAGFSPAESRPGNRRGAPVEEQRYDLALAPPAAERVP